MQPNLTVWYNTKCPVCDAGIGWQKRRLAAAARAGVIEFRDINLEPEALARFGAGLEDIRRRLHGVDAGGQLRVGIDCAIERVRVAQHKASAQKPTSEGPTCDSSSRSLGSRTFRAAIGRGNHWRWR